VSQIDITLPHKLSAKSAREAADKAGRYLATEYGLRYAWQNEHRIAFERPGVNGHLDLARNSVRVTVRLGFPLLLMRDAIEQGIEHDLGQLFSGEAA